MCGTTSQPEDSIREGWRTHSTQDTEAPWNRWCLMAIWRILYNQCHQQDSDNGIICLDTKKSSKILNIVDIIIMFTMLVIDIFVCPGELINALWCRYHKTTKDDQTEQKIEYLMILHQSPNRPGRQCTTHCQLRPGHCKLLNQYKDRIGQDRLLPRL